MEFLREFAERPTGTELVLRILDIPINWDTEDLAAFERNGYAYLITGRWGSLWLAPSKTQAADLQSPAAPHISPLALWHLARALVGVLAVKGTP